MRFPADLHGTQRSLYGAGSAWRGVPRRAPRASRFPLVPALVCLGAAAAAWTCGGDVTAPPVQVPPSDTLSLSIRINPPAAAPGAQVMLEAVATVPAGQQLDSLKLEAPSDLFQGMSLVQSARQGTVHRLNFELSIWRAPIRGRFTLTLAIWVGRASVVRSADLVVYDDLPARFSRAEVVEPAGGRVGPGNNVRVAITATDNAGLTKVIWRVTGAVSATDSLVTPPQPEVRGVLAIVVPADARYGDSVHVALEAVDMFGQTGVASLAVEVSDVWPPTVTGSVLPNPKAATRQFAPPSLFLAGDTAELSVSATDNHRVVWAGYDLPSLGVRDSVAVSGSDITTTMPLEIPPTWHFPGGQRLDLWARDSVGNLDAVSVSLGTFSGIERPVRTIADRAKGTVSDLVYDPLSHRLFMLQRDSGQVAILDLASLTYEPPIPLPGAVFGMDLVPSADSLVVAMTPNPSSDSVQLAVVDLGTRAVTVVALTGASQPIDVVVTSDNRAVLTTFASGYEMNLATGAQRSLAEFVSGPMTRSLDRSIVGMVMSPLVRLYDPALDAVVASLVLSVSDVVSLDSAGRRVIVPYVAGPRLYDRSLTVWRSALPAGVGGFGLPILAPDGSLAYAVVGNEPSYAAISTADITLLERVLLPVGPSRLFALANGEALVILGGLGQPTHVVDLR